MSMEIGWGSRKSEGLWRVHERLLLYKYMAEQLWQLKVVQLVEVPNVPNYNLHKKSVPNYIGISTTNKTIYM